MSNRPTTHGNHDSPGTPEAIDAVFPETVVQTCIVHLIRNSMSFASWKDRKPIAQALRGVQPVLLSCEDRVFCAAARGA
jgi:hypothetical protein